MGVLIFLISLMLLMVAHEAGHALAASWSGLRVYEFGIGLPPRALRLFRWNGVEYTLNWLPFGAFVRLADNHENESKVLATQSWGRRVLILAAGPLANFLLGVGLLAFGHSCCAFQVATHYYEVVRTRPGQLADQIGIRSGDVILAVNGESMESEPGRPSLRDAVLKAAGGELVISVLRDGERLNIQAHAPPDLDPAAPLGVEVRPRASKYERISLPIHEAVKRTAQDIAHLFDTLLHLPANLGKNARPVSLVGLTTLGGAMLSPQLVEATGAGMFLRFVAIVSIGLAITNLLPFPGLDGGRIAFTLVERVTRRPLPNEQLVHGIGILMLIALSLLLVLLDLISPPAINFSPVGP